MQPWDAIHPLLVHFPLGALAIVPVLVLLSIFLKSNSRPFMGAALITLSIGTAGLFLAVSSGVAGAELVDRTAPINIALEHHKELGEATRNIFLGLSAVYAVMAGLFALPGRRIGHGALVAASIVFLALYAAGFLALANTGHEGAELVHKLGVQAMIETGHQADGLETTTNEEDEDLGLDLD